MFEEVGEQFHQLITSSRSSSQLPLPLSFPLRGSFDPTCFPTISHHHHHQLQPHHHHQLLPLLHHPSPPPTHKPPQQEQDLKDGRSIIPDQRIDPWSNDEVLALLKIRSAMENWFPDFTWEHVSRKLAEVGFKRSGEKCKEKFEEESRHFNSMSSYSKNCRLFSELEQLCQSTTENQNPQVLDLVDEKTQIINVEKLPNELVISSIKAGNMVNKEDGLRKNNQKNMALKGKKRKRHDRTFEKLMGFCEEIVKKMMTQQQEMHNKIIEDMVKRDDDKIAKEEAWKKKEMERMNKEIEIRAHEQAIAGERQTKLIDYLKKFTSNDSGIQSSSKRTINELLYLDQNHEVSNASISSATSPSTIEPLNSDSFQNPSSLDTQNNRNVPTSSTDTLAPQNPSSSFVIIENKIPNSSLANTTSQNLNLAQNEREEIGKRWPKEEVLALINLRSSINGNGNEEKELGGAKGPLWERISQGMMGMGYKRSAKRCKEKWENINKYFRKTKDVNKKRSVDARTCPYFHQLSSLYNQGKLVAPGCDPPGNHSVVPGNSSPVPEIPVGLPQGGPSDGKMDVAQGEKDLVQVPALDFEF